MGLKLYGTHQLWAYAAVDDDDDDDDDDTLGGRINTVKKNTKALLIASKETGL